MTTHHEATHEGTLEHALGALERDAEATLRAIMSAAREAKRLKAAASVGKLRDLQQAVENIARLSDQAALTARELRASWHFEATAYFASGEYTKELLAVAADAGVRAVESDQQILCYPSILQVSPPDTAVVIDKKKERRVRPSVLVGHLADLQDKPPKFRPEAFLATLAAAYDLVAPRPGATVKLAKVYGVLTLLPGSSRDYTKPEFARDLYLLDQSGVTVTKDQRVMTLPASALTRGSGVLTTVTKTGQVKVYAGVAFSGGDT